jgi:AbrB family looped-hinge helix DNA binding protein
MTTASISPKFQIVIPKEIRRALGLKAGQRVNFVEKDGMVLLRPILKTEQLVGILADCAQIPFEREPDRELP